MCDFDAYDEGIMSKSSSVCGYSDIPLAQYAIQYSTERELL